eukprot:5280226-Pyramimonas_sp.AAC.1
MDGEGGHHPLENWEVPVTLDGAPVTRDLYWNSGSLYEHVTIRCIKHDGCRKVRGLGRRQCLTLGRREPLAYLHAWHRLGDQYTAENHNKQCKPTPAQVRESFELMDIP